MTLPSIALARACVGLAQGIVLYLLYRAAEAKGWPATEPHTYAALLAVALFIPVVAVAGLGNLRLRTLGAWVVLAAACCAGLAVYDIFREPLISTRSRSGILLPTPVLWPALGFILFVVHSLVAAAEADRRLIASYARYFDVAWKYGVQVVLSVAFVGAFWALLFLCAALFNLIGIRAIINLIEHAWFSVPATTAALACAIHVTDVRSELVRGVRTLVLTLLAWLLPMMMAFAVAFLLALPFTGLQPLWSTKSATAILLAASAALVFLINAAYQDGQDSDSVALAVRYARSIAAVVLVPLAVLAAYGLTLRAWQYGWTPPRIVAGACVIAAGCYAAGYAIAALRPNPALKGLERTNIATACIIVAIMLCLLSPVADPARLAVADQLRRLESGMETPETFDFKFLKFRSGRYGKAALEKLAERTEGPDATTIAEKAKQAMALLTPWDAALRAGPAQRAANITVVHPRGQVLPDSFLQKDWTTETSWQHPRCLTAAGAKCQAALIDLDGDGVTEILLFDLSRSSGEDRGSLQRRDQRNLDVARTDHQRPLRPGSGRSGDRSAPSGRAAAEGYRRQWRPPTRRCRARMSSIGSPEVQRACVRRNADERSRAVLQIDPSAVPR
jgi:hypothetical protein